MIEDKILGTLYRSIVEQLNRLKISKKIRILKMVDGHSRTEPSQQQKADAATIIQKVWRKKKIKHALAKNPYTTYLSLSEPNVLSKLMFGRHVAELHQTSKHRIDNPYIHKLAFYHRSDNLSGILLGKLLRKFNFPINRIKHFIVIPVTFLDSLSLSEINNKFFPSIPLYIMKQENLSIGLVVLPKQNQHHPRILNILNAAGVIASPWEIAINLKDTNDTFITDKKIILDKTLPKTQQELQAHTLYNKLSLIAKSALHPSQKLALCLHKILNNLPHNIKPEAIQRIACMVDMVNTFYEYDYPKFAFAVYTTIHEISLALLEQTEIKDLQKGFSDFYDESLSSLNEILSIDSASMEQARFISCPGMSGTNAYMLAMKLAAKMKTSSGIPPTIKVFKPTYYEFDYLTETTNNSDADIFVLSAGAVANQKGLTPGIDINKFVRRTIINAERKKATTLVIDATSALYKNMHLDPEVQQLIESGALSIIIHESHQKFGMIHTDQAQYGRMMAICSTRQFDSDVISQMQENARRDYASHLDLRVGAYISSTCGKTLEEIKEQHFNNGSLLRTILTQSSLALKEIEEHKDMLANLTELYFVIFKLQDTSSISYGVLDRRDSFGHFSSTLAEIGPHQTRLSPDASDNLDCLIQSAQIYLAHKITSPQALKLLITYTKQTKNFNLSEQIILMALANNLLYKLPYVNLNYLALLFTLNTLMKQCDALKGRQYYNKVAQSYFLLRQNIINAYQVQTPHEFFLANKILNDKNIFLEEKYLHKLSNNQMIRNAIIAYHEQLSNDSLITLFGLDEGVLNQNRIQLMMANKNFSSCIVAVHSTVSQILLNLQSNENKYKQAIFHSKPYYLNCIKALEAFYDPSSRDSNNQVVLINHLNRAKDQYCQDVLGIDRSRSSQAIRYLLKGLVNFIAALTFGIAHYVHYKTAGHVLFFTNTKSQNELERLNDKIISETIAHRRA